MDVLEKVRGWVQTFPEWEEGQLHIDYTGAAPGNTGLFPVGVEEVARREDVLGNVTVSCRCGFLLYRVTTGQEDNEKNAAWLLQFQDWVREQSALGLAPTFGDVPAQERIRAEKGRLKNASQVGTAIYSVELTAEFVKKYNV